MRTDDLSKRHEFLMIRRHLERMLHEALNITGLDVPAVERFCDGLERFLMTVSWGGYESLMFPVAVVHAPDTPLRPAGALPLSLVRLSIGLEEPAVLIRDLDEALARV